MLTLDEKIELAEWICSHNSHVALTGSLMLYLRFKDKYPLLREPDDIDFIVNAYDEEKSFELPPFIDDVQYKMSDYDAYEVLARFSYNGTKIEFIETPIFRYEQAWISPSVYHKKVDFVREFSVYHNDHYNIRYALLTDLIAAKESYLKIDKNEEYLDKTKNDLNLLYPILHDICKDEYVYIVKSYIEHHDWYTENRNDYKDLGRILCENIIYENYVKHNIDKEDWFEYIKKMNYEWHNNYIKTLDYWTRQSYSYTDHVSYNEQKLIDKIIYSYEIPKF